MIVETPFGRAEIKTASGRVIFSLPLAVFFILYIAIQSLYPAVSSHILTMTSIAFCIDWMLTNS